MSLPDELRERREYHAADRIEELEEALTMLYDKWENGDPCYTDADPCGGDFMGNAFKLSEEEENHILALIPNSVLTGSTSETASNRSVPTTRHKDLNEACEQIRKDLAAVKITCEPK